MILCLAAVALAAPPLPTFPQDWKAVETDVMVVFQGPYTQTDSQICCPLNNNCQVQVQFQSGNNYFDYTNNRTRFDIFGSGGQSIVNFFTKNMQMLVVNNTCQEYCPLDDTLEPYGIDPNSTYQGQVSVNGIKCDDWQYKETILGIVVMEIDDIFVNSGVTPAVPVQEVDQLTPFGQPMGNMTSTYDNFVGGPIDPSLFNIANVDSCPQSQNCNSNSAFMFSAVRVKARNTLRKIFPMPATEL